MPRKSKRTQRSHKRSNSARGLWLLQMFIIFFFCSATYVIWMDHRIRTEFEGKRWSLPARVYARPLELYSGLKISRHALVQELQSLGYHRVQRPSTPGEYASAGEKLEFINRTFEFWDGVEPSRRILLRFAGDQILDLEDLSGAEPVPVVRIDPLLIGKIYPEHKEDRALVAYEDVPQLLVDSLIAVEDRHFFNHFGIDPVGILRAGWVNIRTGSIRQGGSTLTQQLIKNFFLSQERTFWRKFNELIMSLLLEWHYSKREILSAYINEVYLGQHGALGIHGFGTAAEFYFSRPLNELRVDQIALLVGLVRGASYYNPRSHPDRARQRRNLVIEQMLELGYLNAGQANDALSASLDIAESPGWSSAKYPAYQELVRRQLLHDYQPEDLRTEGLRIFTTLDPHYQDIAETAVRERLFRLEQERGLKKGTIQVAGVITSIETGEILALIGDRQEEITGFNRALDARRPIGSLIKPAVYLTALSQPDRYNVLSILADQPVSIKQKNGQTWEPKNYDGEVHGDIPLHSAIVNSYNLATVQLGMQLGIPRIKTTLEQLGVDIKIPEYPSLLLGSLELSPLQVAQMYQTMASNGFQIPLRTIREVSDKHGKPLQRFSLDIKRTIDSRAIFITNFLLTEVVNNGTARSLAARLPAMMPLAGKTGTTDELRDSWFAGFGDNILAIIWLGRDDNQPAGLTGASGALTVWTDIMQKINPQPLSLTPPEGVVMVKIIHGMRTQKECPWAKSFPFIEPYLPQQSIQCEKPEPQIKFPAYRPWSL
ncbi:MAG: penicillin-binding protein [Gammaproteobacteria bacterium]|nr:penicillin-binding protein [Gammaproteobacteria bacterium]